VSKFSAEVPKGDGWGIEEVVQEIVAEIVAGGKSRLVPVMGVIDVKSVQIDPESGNHVAVVRVRRLEAITSIERARRAQRMILEQVAERRGEGTMLPFEEKDILERAFGGSVGVNVGQQLQDDEEKTIDEGLNDAERRARHLVAVHDYDAKILNDDEMTDADIERAHDAEHAKDPADRTWPDHDPESSMWRRVDLAEILGDAEEPETETDQPHDGDLRTGDEEQTQEYSEGEWVDVESVNVTNPGFGETFPFDVDNPPIAGADDLIPEFQDQPDDEQEDK
jgi:hypothetical protein